MSDIALCCAPACPLVATCQRHEMHYDNARAWANYGAHVRITALGTFECDHHMALRAYAEETEGDD